MKVSSAAVAASSIVVFAPVAVKAR